MTFGSLPGPQGPQGPQPIRRPEPPRTAKPDRGGREHHSGSAAARHRQPIEPAGKSPQFPGVPDDSKNFQQQPVPVFLGSSAKIDILSASHSYVDVGRMTGWFPVRDLRLNDSNAVVGEDMRVATHDRYDLREVAFTTDGLSDWLARTPDAKEALREAVLGRGSIADFTELIELPPVGDQGTSHARVRGGSLRSMSVSNSRVVLGTGSRVKVNNTYSLRRIEVDVLDCFRHGWLSPETFVGALREQALGTGASGSGIARMIRDGGQAVTQADIASLTPYSTKPITTSETRFSGLGGAKVIDDAALAAIGTGNRFINEVSIQRPGKLVDDLTGGLPAILESIGIDPSTFFEPSSVIPDLLDMPVKLDPPDMDLPPIVLPPVDPPSTDEGVDDIEFPGMQL
jgi:hypothetical protein